MALFLDLNVARESSTYNTINWLKQNPCNEIYTRKSLAYFVRSSAVGMKRKHHFAELNPRDQYIPFVMEQSFVDIVRTPINILLEISHQKYTLMDMSR
jgi:hypothetical protein